MTSTDRPERAATVLVFLASTIVTAEALAFLVLAALDALAVSSERLGFGIGTALFLAVYGGGQLWAAWRLTRGDLWARGPLVFTQLIQLGLAWNLRGANMPWIAALVAGAAGAVLACLLAPPVTRLLGDDQPGVRD